MMIFIYCMKILTEAENIIFNIIFMYSVFCISPYFVSVRWGPAAFSRMSAPFHPRIEFFYRFYSFLVIQNIFFLQNISFSRHSNATLNFSDFDLKERSTWCLRSDSESEIFVRTGKVGVNSLYCGTKNTIDFFLILRDYDGKCSYKSF